MRIFKFGGASVKDAAGFRNVTSIIQRFLDDKPLAIVVSATGKTTNKLEEVVAAKNHSVAEALALLDAIRQHHLTIVKELFGQLPAELDLHLQEHFVEAEWIIEEQREMQVDYIYDQVVSVGELVSSRILAAWLVHEHLDATWVDARDLIITDESYRQARINWDETNRRIGNRLSASLRAGNIAVVQGFIGSTPENNTTTLGREGSDYTAAILANALDAGGMYIWKDVPGVMTADPDFFENVTKLDRLSYREAIEMTYYGCKVIHPKTIQPIKLKGIPLYVKSFLKPEDEGTVIAGDIDLEYPPIVVLEGKQALLHFSSADLSFIAEYHLAYLFGLLDKYRIKVNMMRNSAISFTVCVTNEPIRIQHFSTELNPMFKLVIDPELELLTVRHFQESMLPGLIEGKIVLLEERFKSTVQMVMKTSRPIVPRRS
ncbi:MAG: aspartate kinase [Saprospiraceae bacterium]|nr:aspartate kinase [Saprospiraceae bacterium]